MKNNQHQLTLLERRCLQNFITNNYQPQLDLLEKLCQQQSLSRQSRVSLCISQNGNLNKTLKMLGHEISIARNIKDKKNSDSVIECLARILKYLIPLKFLPSMGLCIFAGLNATQQEFLFHVFEPFQPINFSLFKIDGTFHTQTLKQSLYQEKLIGFIIMDPQQTMLVLVEKNSYKIFEQEVKMHTKYSPLAQKDIEQTASTFYKNKVTDIIIAISEQARDKVEKIKLNLHGSGGDQGLQEAIAIMEVIK